MKTLGAVLVSIGLVVAGLLLLAVLVRLTTLGGATGGGPEGDGGSVAVDGGCEPGRGAELRGVRRRVGQAVEERPWQHLPPGWASGQDGKARDGKDGPAPALGFLARWLGSTGLLSRRLERV